MARLKEEIETAYLKGNPTEQNFKRTLQIKAWYCLYCFSIQAF